MSITYWMRTKFIVLELLATQMKYHGDIVLIIYPVASDSNDGAFSAF